MANDERKSQSDRELPITVAACSVGSDRRGAWWLSMNATGNAIVMMDVWPKMKQIEFTVSEEKIAALRKALSNERFFELKEDYGKKILSGSLRILTIVDGEQHKTVQIRYLMDFIDSDPSKLEEPARALRVFMLIRDWFDDRRAFDYKKYDRMVFNVVEKMNENNVVSSPITNEISKGVGSNNSSDRK